MDHRPNLYISTLPFGYDHFKLPPTNPVKMSEERSEPEHEQEQGDVRAGESLLLPRVRVHDEKTLTLRVVNAELRPWQRENCRDLIH